MALKRLPQISKLRPVKRGELVYGETGAKYMVKGAVKAPCTECGGTGRTWLVRLKSRYGPTLMYTLGWLHKWGYKVERAREESRS